MGRDFSGPDYCCCYFGQDSTLLYHDEYPGRELSKERPEEIEITSKNGSLTFDSEFVITGDTLSDLGKIIPTELRNSTPVAKESKKILSING